FIGHQGTNHNTAMDLHHLEASGAAQDAAPHFVANAGMYGGVHAASQAITMVKGLIVRRLLPPEVFGYWAFAGVVQAVLATCDAGFILAASRELPIAFGRRD